MAQESSEREHQKQFHLVVNGTRKIWTEETISFIQVVDLAYPPPHRDTEYFTVSYTHGPHENTEGTLVDGQSAKVKNEMRFNVGRTDKS